MHRFVVAAISAVVSLSALPAAAQTVTASISVENTGPVTSCTPNFKAHIRGSINFANLSGSRQIQYKWTFSDIGDQPTQTFNAPAAATSDPVAIDMAASGSTAGWVQLTITYPTNVSSNKLYYKLICPTVGSLSSPLTLTPVEMLPR